MKFQVCTAVSALDGRCELLRRIAEVYPVESEEHQLIQLAALSLIYVSLEQRDKFADYLQIMDSPLTPEQNEKLKSMGLNSREGCS